MVRRWLLIGYFPILYYPLSNVGVVPDRVSVRSH
jgi:hypothetical protein